MCDQEGRWKLKTASPVVQLAHVDPSGVILATALQIWDDAQVGARCLRELCAQPGC